MKNTGSRCNFSSMRGILCLATILLTTSTLSGCRRPLNDSDIEQNPQPKQRYETTLTIEDAPGPFESVTGWMAYEVGNVECVPKDPFTGARHVPTHASPFNLTPKSESVLVGNIFLDLLRDEDYFGLGLCRWKAISATALLNVREVSFDTGIFLGDFKSHESVTRYFDKEFFLRANDGKISVGGVPMSDYVVANRNTFFALTMMAKEKAQ